MPFSEENKNSFAIVRDSLVKRLESIPVMTTVAPIEQKEEQEEKLE